MVITNRMGFVKIEGDPNTEEIESTFFFIVQPFKELLTGLDYRRIVTEPADEGVIVRQQVSEKGATKVVSNKTYNVPSGGGQTRLFQIGATSWIGLEMTMDQKPDWRALAALFEQPAKDATSASEHEYVTYLGERVPKWLARDLMAERAAVREYDGVMSRLDAEAETLKDLIK